MLLLRWFSGLLLLLSIARGAETTVTVYNTGDLHAHSANLSRIAAFVKARRAENPNVLLVDAGDLFNKGEMAVQATEGEAMIDLVAASGYDACVLGNHGLSHGAPRTAQLVDRYRFPLLEANAIWPKGIRPVAARPYRIFELQGVRVAVIGTSSEHMNHRRDDMVRRRRIPDALRHLLPQIRKEADIVVLITHVGTDRDRQVATELATIVPNGVDLIVGGHDHRKYEKLVYDEATRTVIMHAGDFGRWLGEVVLTWDGTKITGRRSRLIPITADMPCDPGVEARRQSYVDAFAENEPVARIERDLSREEVTAWIAGVVRCQNGAHAVLAPSQLARTSLPAGPLTTGKLLAAVPCLDVLEFTVPDAAALATVAAEIRVRRVEALCATARKRKGDGEKWVADMLRVVGEPSDEPAPERTPEEAKAFRQIQNGLVLSPGPLLLFAADTLPAGPIRVAYPCAWHDLPCQANLRGLAGIECRRWDSLWRLVRRELPPPPCAESVPTRHAVSLPTVAVTQ